MRALAVARRELLGYFNLPIAYVLVAAFVVLNAAYLFVLHPFFVVNRATLRPLFEFAPFVFTLFVPAVSMRLLAEERRTGTLEVLLTWPLSEWEVVLGKFAGALALLIIAVLLTLPLPLSVDAIGELDWGPVLGGYLGLVLLAAAYLAVGLLVSAFTGNQIVAFIGGFLACFALYIVGRAAAVVPEGMGPWVEAISFERRFANVARGVVDLRDVTWFASLTVVCLGLAAEALAMRRWR